MTLPGHTHCEALAARVGAPIVEGNGLELLRNGPLFFPAFLSAVRRAQETITVQIFRFHGGKVAREFAEAFAERARSGVQVRVLFDAYGTGTMDPAIRSLMVEAGVELRVYNPIRLRKLHRAHRRSHRKIIVVDGRDAFVGGMNLDDAFAGDEISPCWRENAVHVRGPLASVIQTSVNSVWEHESGTATPQDRLLSASHAGTSHAQLFLSEHDRWTMHTLYHHMIRSARYNIHITSAYLIPEADIVDALVKAARRGVEIRLLTTGDHNNITVARMASRASYGRLLRAGVRIFEYLPTMLHAKSIVVDGSWCSVGSTNVDACSLRRNLEANIGTCDPALVAEVERAFEEDLAVADEATKTMWHARPITQRAAEAIALPFRSLL